MTINFADQSGNGNDATPTNFPATIPTVAGPLGEDVAVFDGTDDYFTTPVDTTGWTAITMVGWCKTDFTGDDQAIVAGVHPTPMIRINNSNGRLALWSSTGGTARSLSSSDLRDGNWHFIGGSFDESDESYALVADDTNSDTGTISGATIAETGLQSGKYLANADYFNGSPAYLAIFDTKLSVAQMQALHAASTPAAYKALAISYGAVGYWSMSDDSAAARAPHSSHACLIEGQLDWCEGTFHATAGSGTLDGKLWGQRTNGYRTIETAVDPDDAAGRRALHFQSVGASEEASVELRLRHMQHGEASSPGFGGDAETLSGRVLLHFHLDVSVNVGSAGRIRFFQTERDTSNVFNVQIRKGTGTGELRLQTFVNGANVPNSDSDNTYGPSTFQNFLGEHCTALIDYRASTGSTDGLVRVYIATGRYYTSADVLANGTKMLEVTHNATTAFERFNLGQKHISYAQTSDLYHEWIAWKGSRTIDDTFPAVEVIRDPLVGQIRDVTKNSVGIFVRAPGGYYKQNWHNDGDIRASIRYWPIEGSEGSATETSKFALASADRWGACTTITGLTEGQDYLARVRLYDETDDGDFVDALHTLSIRLGSGVSTIGQACCIVSSGAAHPHELFDRLVEQDARHCLVIDDVGYFDGHIGDDQHAETEDEYREAFLHTLLDGPMIRFGRQGSLIFKAGDHQFIDAFQNSYKTSGSTPTGYSVTYTTLYTNAKAAWASWAGDAMLGKLTGGEFYRSLDWGSTQIVIPDDVTFRDSGNNTMLGATQKAALKTAWDGTAAKLIIWTPVRWNGPTGAIYSDNWHTTAYQAERQEIEQDWLTDAPNARIYIASGDRHFVEANNAFADGDYGRTAAATTVWLEATIGPGSARQWPEVPSEHSAIKTVFEDVVGTGAMEWSRRYGVVRMLGNAVSVTAHTAEDGVQVGAAQTVSLTDSAIRLAIAGFPASLTKEYING